MAFLAGLLPGVRDLRGPLVCGALWLGLLYYWLWHHASAVTNSPAFAPVDELSGRVGALVAGAASALVVYLLGALLLPLGEMLAQVGTRRALRIIDAQQDFTHLRQRFGTELVYQPDAGAISRVRTWLSVRSFNATMRFLPVQVSGASRVASRLERYADEVGVSGVPPEFQSLARHPANDLRDRTWEHAAIWLFQRAVLLDILSQSLGARLLVRAEFAALYQEYDRLRAEVDLRFAAFLPSLGIGLSVILRSGASPMWASAATLLVLAYSAALFGQALSRRADAGDLLALAVGDELISTPTLDRAIWWSERQQTEVAQRT